MDPSGALEAAVSVAHAIRYSELASSTLIIFDHLITLDQEVQLIWNSSFSLGKCLFLINRYYTLLSVVFNNYALFSPNITDTLYVVLSYALEQVADTVRPAGWTGLVSFVLAELILQLRLYALYFLDKRVLVFMIASTTLATAACAAVLALVLKDITATSDSIQGLPFCVASGISRHFYTFWIPMLVSETILCGLALFRGFQNYCCGNTLFRSGKYLVEFLIRDSMFYFVVMFATYLCNAIVFIVRTNSEVEIPIGFAVALSCVMGNRLCLNVRGMIRQKNALPTLSFSAPSLPSQTYYSTTRPSRPRPDSGHYVLTQFELTEMQGMRTERPPLV